jgi:hypothetical protein
MSPLKTLPFLLSISLSGSSLFATTNIQTILYSGQAIPGDPDYIVDIRAFFKATITPGGVVALTAYSYATDSSSFGSFLMVYNHGQSQVLLDSPSTTDSNGNSLFPDSYPVLSPDGRYVSTPVYLVSAANPSSFLGSYIWDLQANPSQPIIPTQNSTSVQLSAIDNSGTFTGTVDQPDGTSNLVIGTPSSITTVASVNNPNPGPTNFLYLYNTSITPSGSAIFSASNQNAPSGGMYIASPTTFQSIAALNDPAPGIPNAWFSGSGGSTLQTNDGRTVINATVAGPGISTTSNEGIWIGSSLSSLKLVVRQGSQAPHDSRTFVGLGQDATTNTIGQIVFSASLEYSIPSQYPENSIWITDPSETILTKFVETGDPAPGTPYVFNSLGPCYLNNNGLIALEGGFSLPSGEEEFGLWIGTPGNIQPLLVTGDQFDLNGVSASVDFVRFVNSSPTAFSDDGHVLAQVDYTDYNGNSGQALVLLSVPEPSTLLLFSATAAILGRRQRQARSTRTGR